MGMMNQMQSNMFKQNLMNQMQRNGIMNFNPNMPGFPSGMMNFGMNGQIQNPMMRGMPFNPQMNMFPPSQQIANFRNMMMNQNLKMNPNNFGQNDDYVPGTLEENAIKAITNTDYK